MRLIEDKPIHISPQQLENLQDLIATFAPAPADDIALLALTVLATDIGGGP
ncbi:MAG TPA: hypothetical protein VGO16_08030 [Pseudonocardiaceae bacterium]|nr:hypothetical protein [Pseudonocardiaceae bacterium]